MIRGRGSGVFYPPTGRFLNFHSGWFLFCQKHRYTRKAAYNKFTMASGAPTGGGGSLADRGTWGMFHSDGISGYNNAEVPVRTDVHYYNQNGSSTLDWNNSNFVYCIHNRKRSPSGTYYPEISFSSVPSYVNSSVWRS